MVLAVVPAVVLEVAIAVARKIQMAFTIMPVVLLALAVVLDVVVLMAMAVLIVPLLLLLQLLLLPPSPLLVIEAAEVVIAVFVLFFSPCGQFSLHRTECWHGPV